MVERKNKYTLLQINSVCNWGSTGKIAEAIGKTVMSHGWNSVIAFGQKSNPSASKTLKIGTKFDLYWHGMMTRLFDRHGLESRNATRKLIYNIRILQPDIILLHNIHGYYLNYPILFKFLKEYNKPVVWTFHDCWPFTGHCAYFEIAKCYRWHECCHNCPNKKFYPASWLFDRSTANYWDKKHWFNLPNNITLVPVSDWLEKYLHQSFLSKNPIQRIHNGIDTSIFKYQVNSRSYIRSKFRLSGDYLVIGVASVWEERKGLKEFYKLRKSLPSNYDIIVVGLTKQQISVLPSGIIGIQRTNGIKELVAIYSAADLLFNPTLEDTLPTVNLESQSCGTPVITYNSGGCPETIINGKTGYVVRQKDIKEAFNRIEEVCFKGTNSYRDNCRNWILSEFKKEDRYEEYFNLFDNLLKQK